MRFTDLPPGPPPVLFGTIGPLGLDLAGRAFDGAILHPFLTAEAVAASAALRAHPTLARGRIADTALLKLRLIRE